MYKLVHRGYISTYHLRLVAPHRFFGITCQSVTARQTHRHTHIHTEFSPFLFKYNVFHSERLEYKKEELNSGIKFDHGTIDHDLDLFITLISVWPWAWPWPDGDLDPLRSFWQCFWPSFDSDLDLKMHYGKKQLCEAVHGDHFKVKSKWMWVNELCLSAKMYLRDQWPLWPWPKVKVKINMSGIILRHKGLRSHVLKCCNVNQLFRALRRIFLDCYNFSRS